MQIFNEKKYLIKYLGTLSKNQSIGFVATMGSLHSGHLSLIQSSKSICSITICSIFINPTQFNNIEDYKNYPKDYINDIKLLENIDCDILYIPQTEDIYEEKTVSIKYDLGKIAENLEGKYRPGHFDGVATVVDKLFNIIKPQVAFFGEKDLQQLQVIRKLVEITNRNIDIVGVKTIRESNGLAKSSRNKLLSKEQIKEAAIIFKCLQYCKLNKDSKIKDLKLYVEDQFLKNQKIKLEYIEFIEINNFNKIDEWREYKTNAVCIAAYINNVRLIDNIIL
tara:strand:- start:46742 stop:47578 length:837 start_codon:yes stop_codon:yes gene_type:complete